MATSIPPDADARLAEHRKVWGEKETLRVIYLDYYQRMFAALGDRRGRVLDIGGGSAHAKDVHDNIVTLDILPFPGIDVVADAHEMPFPDASFAGIVMLDVLHHLERPVAFLKEAARVLEPGARLAMIEPGITPASWPFYNFLHQEPVIWSQDPFAMTERRPDKDPFDSNQAIPTLMLGRKRGIARLAQAVPELKVVDTDWLSLVAYPLSGGFKRWCLVPPKAAAWAIAAENRVPRPLRRLLAFRLLAVLERTQ
jgi:SAM-dependent methyltransferase